jgi:hypothetical protein
MIRRCFVPATTAIPGDTALFSAREGRALGALQGVEAACRLVTRAREGKQPRDGRLFELETA